MTGQSQIQSLDSFGRTIDYLRISITDRCNERCLYCMPEGYKGWQCQPDHLTADEIVNLTEAAASLGFRKFRLTGGEPLVRRDVVSIVRAMAQVPGVGCIGLSTNGTRLAALAQPLKEAGLRTVNVSLDALDPAVYRRITGGKIEDVLAGIRAAVDAGFECVKLNCVLMRGLNEQEIWPLVLFAAEHRLPLRLIELMPVTTADVLTDRNFFPVTDAMRLIAERDVLIAQPNRRIGWGPAKSYLLQHTGALVGFIGAMTSVHFCDSCNKMRVTADGKVRPCLGDHGELDLRTVLRAGADKQAIRDALLVGHAAQALGTPIRQPLPPLPPHDRHRRLAQSFNPSSLLTPT